MRCWWSWGRKGSVTIWIVFFSLEEWACRDLGLWPPAAYGKVMTELSKWQMALDVLVIPLLTVNLTIPNWLATGGTWWRHSTEWWPLAKWNVLPQHCERIMEARQWLPPADSPTAWGICGQWAKQLQQQELPKSCSASAEKSKCRRMSTHLFKPSFCWCSCRV